MVRVRTMEMLTIGQVAEKAEVNIQTLRYYERRRILAPAARRESGYRLYEPGAVRTVRFIKRAQQLGFSLQDIQVLLGLRAGKRVQCEKVRSKAEEALRGIETKIAQLDSMRQALKSLIRSCGEGKTQERCPILEAFDVELGGTP